MQVMLNVCYRKSADVPAGNAGGGDAQQEHQAQAVETSAQQQITAKSPSIHPTTKSGHGSARTAFPKHKQLLHSYHTQHISASLIDMSHA